MSGVGASTCTMVMNRNNRKIDVSGNNHFRQTVNVTLTGYTPTNAVNLAVFLFRQNTLVATGGTFTESLSVASGAIETNTEEMEDAFDGVNTGAFRALILRIYDGNSTELLGTGLFTLAGFSDAYPGATPVSPVTGTTVIWGKFAYYGGQTYAKSDTDGLWYPMTFQGAGGSVHVNWEETGIVITA